MGAGFAGFNDARELCRLARGRAEIIIVNPTDYFLYTPLLPEVAAGLLDPRDVTVSLPAALPDVRLVLAEATKVDLDRRCVYYCDAEDRRGSIDYHRLVLALGLLDGLLNLNLRIGVFVDLRAEQRHQVLPSLGERIGHELLPPSCLR